MASKGQFVLIYECLLNRENSEPIRRFIVKNVFQRIVISAFILSCFLFTASNAWSVGTVNKVAIKIDSRCEEPCPIKVETALKKLPGVLDASVSFFFGLPDVVVKYEVGKVTLAQINKALMATGYMNGTRIK